MGKQLRDIENDLAQEKDQAEQWIEEHEGELPPPTEEWREQVRLDDGVKGTRFVSLDTQLPLTEEQGFIEFRDKTGKKRRTSIAEEPEEEFSPARWENIERVQAVLEAMEEAQSDLLRRHVLWGETYTELRRAGESRQAVFQRFKRAKKAFAATWKELFGEEYGDEAGPSNRPSA